MSTPEIVTDASTLTPGCYSVGIKNEDSELDWNSAPFYQYVGEGSWLDEAGEEVESFFDPILQLHVATNAPDAYMRALVSR